VKRRAFVPLLILACLPCLADEWPLWGGRPERNMVSNEKDLVAGWEGDGKDRMKWTAPLGTETFGNPVIAGGRVLIGTNNGAPRDPAVTGDKGILLCLSAKDGTLLWQAVHDKLPTGEAEDWPNIGICSTPAVVGDRVYYVSNRGELVCADLEGFSDGENDGPYQDEVRNGPRDADIVWILDFRKELGVTPHQASSSSPLVVDGRVFALTGHGVDEKTHKVKDPSAPSFVAVDAGTGKVIWKDASPGARIMAGQWASPAYGVVDGKPQVAFPGGDGVVYAFDPASGAPLWSFDCRSHEKPGPDGKRETENHLVATPVYDGHRFFIAVGQDPEAGDHPGCLRAIDARQRGDLTKTGELWKLAGKDFGCSISTVAVKDGILYATELGGYVGAVDVASGKRLWRHDLLSTVWGSPLVADGKVYVRNSDGELITLAAGTEKKVLATSTLTGLGHGTLVVSEGVFYLAGGAKLYALRGAR
jgi:outer membrane protein assembly factor BamB